MDEPVADPADHASGTAMTRRRFVSGVAAAGAAGAALGGGIGYATGGRDPRTIAEGGDRSVAFHGEHQAGILTAQQPHAIFAAFDLTVAAPNQLASTLATVTERARSLATGGPSTLAPGSPRADSGIVGPVVPPENLTVTIGLGASVFDDRFGLADQRPLHLVPMPTFDHDSPVEAASHGDLIVQVCADHLDTCLHALRDLTRYTAGSLRLRWRIAGFVSPPRPSGAPRNLMGFKDGIANPDVNDPVEMDRLVWVVPSLGEPPWTTGGSYMVVRTIRMLLDAWDRTSVAEQELIIGRSRDDGAPLGQQHEDAAPDYAAGTRIPPYAHIRRANPRTPATDSQRILRRGYNYDRSEPPEMGLIFCCFQQDVDRQFATIQKRLENDPLAEYLRTTGGGYFFALPGARGEHDALGSSLFGG